MVLQVERLIICITGMPGAGKTTAARSIEGLGFERLSMGDIVREEAKKRGYGLDAEGQRIVQKMLRDEGGPSAIAELCSKKIIEHDMKRVLIDGVRSTDEIKTFSKIGRVKILCIHASPSKRFEYLRLRGRDDDPASREDFERRDNTELNLGVGSVIALADRMVENEVITIEELQKRVREIVKEWVDKL